MSERSAAARPTIVGLGGTYAVTINTAASPVKGGRTVADDEFDSQLNILALQVVQFARMRAAHAREMSGS
jgi:hypothetical protein